MSDENKPSTTCCFKEINLEPETCKKTATHYLVAEAHSDIKTGPLCKRHIEVRKEMYKGRNFCLFEIPTTDEC